MDENPGQPPVPQVPPTPTYAPPAEQQYAPPPAPQYAPPAAPQYAPQAPAPKKKKTWLWIVLGIVVLGLVGCCAIAAIGGSAFFSFMSGPSDSLDAMNQAAIDGDQAAFDKYLDAEAIATNAYDDFIEYFKQQPDYQTIVDEFGEDEAERLLVEEYMPQADFVTEIADSMKLSGDPSTDQPFPNYSVGSTNIEDNTANLTVTADSADTESGTMTFELGFVKEDYEGEEVWRLKEIKNFVELMEAQGGLTE